MSLTLIISAVYLASAILLLLTAGIILKENAKSGKNRVVAAMLFWAGIGPLLAVLYRTVIIDPTQLTESTLNIFYIWEFFFPTLLLFSVMFPESLPFYRRHKRLLQLAFVPHIFHLILVIFFSNPEKLLAMADLETSVPLLGLGLSLINSVLKLVAALFEFLFSFHTRFFSLINLAYVVLAVYFLRDGLNRLSNPAFKSQVRVVIFGIVTAVGLYVMAVMIPTILSLKFPKGIKEAMIVIALIVGPGSIAWSIIKYRFLDIGIIARQSLIYTLSTAIVVGGYLLIITQFSSLFFEIFGLQSRIFDILLVVLLLLFFQPIYTQVDDFVRRIFIRSRSDYHHLMEEFSRRLITVFEIDRLVKIVGDTLNEEMFIERTFFALKDGDNGFKLLNDSKNYILETDINDLLIDKQQPIYLNSIKNLCHENYLTGRLIDLKAHLLLPLADKGRLVGLIATSEKTAGFKYSYEDISLLSVLANQAVVAINNSRLYAESLDKQRLEEELALARQIQIELLPKRVPEHHKFEFAAVNLPSRQVGGDYYDFLELDDGNLGVVVADVSGKGVGAALLSARLQAVLQTVGSRKPEIGSMMAKLNEFLVSSTAADKFVTMFYTELDYSSGKLVYCNAGHNYPILINKNDDVVYLKDGGLILGALTGSVYQTAETKLKKDEVLIIYTDGLSEAFSEAGEEFGEKRLIEAARNSKLQSARFICGHLIKTIKQFASVNQEFDDMTLVVIKGK